MSKFNIADSFVQALGHAYEGSTFTGTWGAILASCPSCHRLLTWVPEEEEDFA